MESAEIISLAPKHSAVITHSIAYLAPHLPSFSTTFVYEELLAIERLGIRVVPFSIFPTHEKIPGQVDLHLRTQVLYGSGTLVSRLEQIVKSLTALPSLGGGIGKAFR